MTAIISTAPYDLKKSCFTALPINAGAWELLKQTITCMNSTTERKV